MTQGDRLTAIKVLLVFLPVACFGQTGASQVFTRQNGTGSVLRSVESALNEIQDVRSYGAIGNFGAGGSHDDTTAIRSAITAACAFPGARVVKFPPPLASGYWMTSTISFPCGNITLDFDNFAKVIYTGTGDQFDTNGKSNITFNKPFLAGPGGVANQNGIHINNSNAIYIRDGFLGAFGVKPTTNTISACTAANPIVCTSPIAPASGVIILGGFSNAGTWSNFNAGVVATHLTAATFSIPFDGTGYPAIAGRVAWRSTDESGCAIKITPDSLQSEISWTTIEVWGTGICADATIDGANWHDNVFGVSTGNASGWAITSKNSVGSGQIKINHNQFTNPGGAMDIGPAGGEYYISENEQEALNINPPLMNQYSTAYHLDQALNYSFMDNVGSLHALGNNCFTPVNSSYGAFQRNSCFQPVMASFNIAGVGSNLQFDNNVDLSVGTPNTYSNPDYIGILTRGYFNGYVGQGTQYPQSPYHYNTQFPAPFNFGTTLAAAITTTAQSVITLTSGTGLVNGMLLYIGNEVLPITDSSASPVFTVSRGMNGTTAATHLINAPVSLGPAGTLLITSAGVSGTALGLGVGNGFTYIKGTAPLGGGAYTPVPHFFWGSTLVKNGNQGSTNAATWCTQVENAGANDASGLCETSSAYTTGGSFTAVPNSATFLRFPVKFRLIVGTGATAVLLSDGVGKTGIGGTPVFANNAAAIGGGLSAGMFYRTGADPDPVMVVH